MRLGVIYKVSIGKNFIIGSTIHPYKRELDYKSQIKRGFWKNDYVQNTFNKDTTQEITWEILQNNIPENILHFVEDIWIGSKNGRIECRESGMNMRDGSRPNHSQETKDKISKARKGIKLTEEHRQNSAKARIGRVTTQETKNKIGLSNSRKVFQYDLQGNFIKEWIGATFAAKEIGGFNELIIKCCKGYRKKHKSFQWFYDYQGEKIGGYRVKSNGKKVIQKDFNGLFIKEWDSITQIQKELNYSISNISQVLNGKRNSAYKFKWEFV
jgi:hypothetical protein